MIRLPCRIPTLGRVWLISLVPGAQTQMHTRGLSKFPPVSRLVTLTFLPLPNPGVLQNCSGLPMLIIRAGSKVRNYLQAPKGTSKSSHLLELLRRTQSNNSSETEIRGMSSMPLPEDNPDRSLPAPLGTSFPRNTEAFNFDKQLHLSLCSRNWHLPRENQERTRSVGEKALSC